MSDGDSRNKLILDSHSKQLIIIQISNTNSNLMYKTLVLGAALAMTSLAKKGESKG